LGKKGPEMKKRSQLKLVALGKTEKPGGRDPEKLKGQNDLDLGEKVQAARGAYAKTAQRKNRRTNRNPF